ncbi:MAG: hypothetical protein AAF689_11905 [Pseudomonadota bacterium]
MDQAEAAKIVLSRQGRAFDLERVRREQRDMRQKRISDGFGASGAAGPRQVEAEFFYRVQIASALQERLLPVGEARVAAHRQGGDQDGRLRGAKMPRGVRGIGAGPCGEHEGWLDRAVEAVFPEGGGEDFRRLRQAWHTGMRNRRACCAVPSAPGQGYIEDRAVPHHVKPVSFDVTHARGSHA